MEPTDQELYDQLVGYLAAEGEVVENLAEGVLTLTEYNYHRLDPPLRLHLTPAAFGRHLRIMAEEPGGAFPEVPPIEEAWRLFTIHVMEGVETAKPGATELIVVPGGVVARQPEEVDGLT